MAILSSPVLLFDDVVIRPAQPGEEDIVLDLLAEAAAWLRGRGIAQWPVRFSARSVQTQIRTGELLVVQHGSDFVATLAVGDDDSALWGVETAPALYLSRLAVASHGRGVGLGYRLIDWVESKAAEFARQYVRLATASDNPGLRRYYEQAGFEHVADPLGARWPTSLYQRPVTSAPHRRSPD